MANSKAARRYAKALFDLAKDENKLDAVGADMAALGVLMAESTDLVTFLGNHMIPPHRRIQVLGLLFEGQLDPLTFRFLLFLDDKRRTAHLSQIIIELGRLFDKHQGVLRVAISTAQRISEEQVRVMVSRLEARFKMKVVPELKVDGSLLGGFRVRVEDYIYDYSAETRLQSIYRKLVTA